jgi:hypothetical protein
MPAKGLPFKPPLSVLGARVAYNNFLLVPPRLWAGHRQLTSYKLIRAALNVTRTDSTISILVTQ